jgi:flagellar biosynthesis chaperone FliJ
LSAARQARVDELENAAESLAAKNRELERTQAALRQTLEESTQLTQNVADLKAIVGSLRAREGVANSFLDAAATAIKQARETP